MPKQFIKTSDSHVADMLKENGFQLLSHCADIYTFANDDSKNVKMIFANDLSKLAFSNKLEF